jgi:hypothetical protein
VYELARVAKLAVAGCSAAQQSKAKHRHRKPCTQCHLQGRDSRLCVAQQLCNMLDCQSLTVLLQQLLLQLLLLM